MSMAVLAAGCGGSGDDLGFPPVTTGQFRSLQFTFSTTKAAFAPGETVPFTFTVTNTGAQEVVATTPGGAVQPSDPVDAVIERSGTLIWNKNEGRGGPTVALPLRFAPGQTRRYTFSWRQTDRTGRPVGTGAYRVRAFLPVGLEGVTDAETELAAAPMDILVR